MAKLVGSAQACQVVIGAEPSREWVPEALPERRGHRGGNDRPLRGLEFVPPHEEGTHQLVVGRGHRPNVHHAHELFAARWSCEMDGQHRPHRRSGPPQDQRPRHNVAQALGTFGDDHADQAEETQREPHIDQTKGPHALSLGLVLWGRRQLARPVASSSLYREYAHPKMPPSTRDNPPR